MSYGGLKAKLDSELQWLDYDVRSQVIDDVLRILSRPTDFMVAAGAHALGRNKGNDHATRAELMWHAMVDEAKAGG